MKRRLSLKSEYVSPLTTDELRTVGGAGSLTGVYPTIDRPCVSENGVVCVAVAALPTLKTECPTELCFTGTTLHTVGCN